MEYGVILVHIEDAIPLSQLAVAAQPRGFDALFVPEHTHIPISPRAQPCSQVPDCLAIMLILLSAPQPNSWGPPELRCEFLQ
jgi:hypothetical protein